MAIEVNLAQWFQVYCKNIQDAWRTIPNQLKDKFRGKFTSILSEALAIHALIEKGFRVEELRFGQSSYDLRVNGKKLKSKLVI